VKSNSNKLIVFRPDTSPSAGLGHFVRSFRLAVTLQRIEFKVVFAVSPSAPELVRAMLRKARISTIPFRAQTDTVRDATRFCNLLRGLRTSVEWLIVDDYSISSNWEKLVSKQIEYLGVFDDLDGRKHTCQLIINAAVMETGAKYQAEQIKGTRLLLGPRFYIPDPFAPKTDKRESASKRRRSILFFIGASGTRSDFTRTLDMVSLAAVQVGMHVYAVPPQCMSGPVFSSASKNVTIVHDYSKLSTIMRKVDFYVGSGGSITMDRVAVSLPGVVFSMAKNQNPLCNSLAKIGAQIYIGPLSSVTYDVLQQSVARLANQNTLKQMSKAYQNMADGKGAQRVASHILHYPISLRRANLADESLLLSWRNHPTVRKSSLNTRKIGSREHHHWFQSKVCSSAVDLLIAESGAGEVGILRYDKGKKSMVTVSIYLNPALVGMGFGSKILDLGSQWLRVHRPGILGIQAFIKNANTISRQAFLKAGYLPGKRAYIYSF
jgi:UDP-2,4-diacetamido-2,4,6-trideoxy-beta-L-altropyranose hydrolase